MSADPKIIDIISQKDGGDPMVSLEFFPPRTEDGVKNLYSRMDRMRDLIKPVFTDMTWGAGGSTADLSLQLALHAHDHGHVANLHMTCTNLGDGNPQQAIKQALQQAYDGGIRNIVALRGDPPAGQKDWTAAEGGFTCALDLVKFIRQEFGSEFGVSVAGYPEGHPNAISKVDDPSTLTESEKKRMSTFDGITYCCLDKDYKTEMDYLKQKVDAGADFIMTQMFFDSAVLIQFVKDCRQWGIQCPVVPGLMCINNYPGFVKMTNFCKTRVPEALMAKMEELKDDQEGIKQFGIEFGIRMCQDLMASGEVNILHFYTLNLEKVVYGVTDGLGISKNALGQVNESDAASQVAKGSAWARAGDRVKSIYGQGSVLEVNQDSGAAKIEIDTWLMAGGQKPLAYLAKGQYQKVF